jgi:chemotaxis protein methyltransferase CheR
MKPADFDYIRTFVREKAAIVLDAGKEYLVESRLESLIQREKIGSLEMLMEQLRSDSQNGLHRKVLDVMTTNETSFFRDLHPFEALRNAILPELICKRASQRQLNFWCGASSTGQEPYSVLMLIAENFPELFQWNFRFIATDLCRDVVSRAQSGRFNQLEVNRGLPAALLLKYFTRQGSEWEFREDLRKRVEFREMNLLPDWPYLAPCDIVFLRNVLIYFEIEIKKAILAKVRRVLRPGGYLFLGGAETTFNLDETFDRVVVNKTTCYRLKEV